MRHGQLSGSRVHCDKLRLRPGACGLRLIAVIGCASLATLLALAELSAAATATTSPAVAQTPTTEPTIPPTAAATQPAEGSLALLNMKAYLDPNNDKAHVSITDAAQANVHGNTFTFPMDALVAPPRKKRFVAGRFLIGQKAFYLQMGEENPVGYIQIGSVPKHASGHLQITSARYGSPDNWQDVTDKLSGMITDDRLGGEPINLDDLTVGEPRRLEIDGTYADVPFHLAFDVDHCLESFKLSLAPVQPMLRINPRTPYVAPATALPVAYTEPNVAAIPIKLADLKASPELRTKLANILARDAAGELDFNKPADIETAEDLLGLALALDPLNRNAVVTNAKFARLGLPKQPSTRPVGQSAAELTSLAKVVVDDGGAEDKRLAADLYDLALQLSPSSDEAIYQSEILKKAGIPADWAWAHSSSPVVSGGARIHDYDQIVRADYSNRVKTFARRQSSIHGLEVELDDDGRALGGKAFEIIATVSDNPDPGPVRVLGPVGADMLTSANEAARAVMVRYPHWQKGAVEISFEDKYEAKDGGSAAGAFGVLMLSLLEGFDIDPKFAMTGDITVDWKLRQIGGVEEKIRGATVDGCTIVSIPLENAERVSDVAVLDGDSALWAVQIFASDTLMEAVHLARTDRAPALAQAIQEFSEIQASLNTQGIAYLSTEEARTRLEHVLKLAPDHLSASYLLAIADHKGPRRLSLAMSIFQIMSVAQPWEKVLNDDKWVPTVNGFDHALTEKSLERLRVLRGKVAPEAAGLSDAMTDFIAVCADFSTGNADVPTIASHRQAVLAALESLSEKRENIEKLLREGL